MCGAVPEFLPGSPPLLGDQIADRAGRLDRLRQGAAAPVSGSDDPFCDQLFQPGSGLRYRHDAGDRPAMFGDGHSFSLLDLVEMPAQVVTQRSNADLDPARLGKGNVDPWFVVTHRNSPRALLVASSLVSM